MGVVVIVTTRKIYRKVKEKRIGSFILNLKMVVVGGGEMYFISHYINNRKSNRGGGGESLPKFTTGTFTSLEKVKNS